MDKSIALSSRSKRILKNQAILEKALHFRGAFSLQRNSRELYKAKLCERYGNAGRAYHPLGWDILPAFLRAGRSTVHQATRVRSIETHGTTCTSIRAFPEPIRYNKLRKFRKRRIENSPQNKGQGQRHLVE